MSKSRFTPQERLKIVKEYLGGNTSYIKLGRKYWIDESCIRQWIAKYKAFGDGAFEQGSNHERYTAAFKRLVVDAYLRGEGSYRDISVAFKIHSGSTVLQWVSQYNNHIELTDSRPEGVTDMVKIKGRKTTYEERIEIVEDCIKNGCHYSETSAKYQISYGQAYQWVRKFREKGIDGLKDKRGQAKPTAELSELDRLRVENRLLTAENKRMELENEFLKKLDEIERGRS